MLAMLGMGSTVCRQKVEGDVAAGSSFAVCQAAAQQFMMIDVNVPTEDM